MKFPKERFFWIGLCIVFVIAIFVLLFNNFSAQRELRDSREKGELLSEQIGTLEDSLKQLEKRLRDVPALNSWDIDKFKEKGLQNPSEDLMTDLRNHRELIPYKGVLGGTMNFYQKDDIHILTSKWVFASFDDGHIGGYMLLEYTVSNAGKISWRVIDSYLD